MHYKVTSNYDKKIYDVRKKEEKKIKKKNANGDVTKIQRNGWFREYKKYKRRLQRETSAIEKDAETAGNRKRRGDTKNSGK